MPWWAELVVSGLAGLCPTLLVWLRWYPKLERNRAKREMVWHFLTREVSPDNTEWLDLFGRIRVEYNSDKVRNAWVVLYGNLRHNAELRAQNDNAIQMGTDIPPTRFGEIGGLCYEQWPTKPDKNFQIPQKTPFGSVRT